MNLTSFENKVFKFFFTMTLSLLYFFALKLLLFILLVHGDLDWSLQVPFLQSIFNRVVMNILLFLFCIFLGKNTYLFIFEKIKKNKNNEHWNLR